MEQEHYSNLDDYERVRSVLANLTENWRDQPSLEDLAAPVGEPVPDNYPVFGRDAFRTEQSKLDPATV